MHLKNYFLTGSCFLFLITMASAQKSADFNIQDVSRVINTLASDKMKGRKTYSPEINKAAAFIASEFKKAGLQNFGSTGYLQNFSLVSARQDFLSAKTGDTELDPKTIVVITDQPDLNITPGNQYLIEKINTGDNFFTKAIQYSQSGENTIVLVDTSFQNRFARLASLKRSFFKTGTTTVFVLGIADIQNLTIKAKHTIEEKMLSNVIGILPGKNLSTSQAGRKNEYVIFSAHYDHIGIGTSVKGDSIYNGANDDASGTTAVIELAKYFKKKNNNSRTILFVAFTAEESGGFGSQYFSKQLDPQKVMAMFNIEMIGTYSKWGKNSAYITGYERTSMGDILQKNLKGSGFNFYPDPYPDQQLFFRSDNASLARLGVPAHTISTSKMDNEPNYHQPSDEVKTLDLKNMTQIIKSIAISSQSIISGKDTPTRVKVEALNR